MFLWKNGISENIKAHLAQHPPALQQLFSPHLFNFIQKIVSPTPNLKKRAENVFYMRDYKGETIKFYTILYGRFFIYEKTVKS